MAAAMVMWSLITPSASAQDADYTAVSSPYQDDFDYRIGADLRPRVAVDGVRWIRFSIKPKNDREYEPSKPAPVTIEVDVLNNGDSADLLLIILFEDEDGTALDRLELDKIKAGRGRLREEVQKHKVTASVLEATRKIYLFFEVAR
jgi:hypothetical protein